MIRHLTNLRYIEHFILWVLMFLFIFDYHYWEGNWGQALQSTGFEVGIYVFLFYLNYKLLIPYFLKAKGVLVYCVVVLLALLSYIFVIKTTGLEARFYEAGYWRNIASMTVNFLLFWLISALYWQYQKRQEEREAELLLKAEKLETKIQFLKNQLSPHFIFNTLDNIYSLVQQGHQNAAPWLAKLSTFLRFVLYESLEKRTLLQKELHSIEQYIELQLLRMPKSKNVDFYTEGINSQAEITPLILLSLIENAFKHSNLQKSEEAWIRISCVVEEGELLFSIENSKDSLPKTKEKGLGNSNIIRQLELNYPNQHTFETTDESNIYSCKLSIQL